MDLKLKQSLYDTLKVLQDSLNVARSEVDRTNGWDSLSEAQATRNLLRLQVLQNELLLFLRKNY